MKKLYIIITIVLYLVSSFFVFAQENIQETKKVEATEYYGYLSLIVDVHLEIGRWEADDKSIFFVVWLLNDMKHYADMDIIEYLWYSFDIRKTLDSLLNDINDILNQSNASITYLKNNLLSLKTKKTECDSLKDVSDKNFYLALKDLDSKSMELNLIKSLDYDKCSSDSRIYYNVQDKMLEELNFYYKILDHKYNYFYWNRFSIIENYPKILYELIK